MKPLARKKGIFAENLPDEVVLYDKTDDKVHCLSKTAAAVWENSDGSKTVDELTRVVKAKAGASVNRKLVLQALGELEEAGLMEAGSGLVPEGELTSRRAAVGKMVMAGSALVASIVAAAPKAHASDPPPPPKGGKKPKPLPLPPPAVPWQPPPKKKKH